MEEGGIDMEKIRIYQIENIADCKYAFMSWDYAQDKCKMDDYKLVATFEMENTYFNLLDEIWRIGNNGTLQREHKMRSISVSDIIEVNGVRYYVDSYGFEEVK